MYQYIYSYCVISILALLITGDGIGCYNIGGGSPMDTENSIQPLTDALTVVAVEFENIRSVEEIISIVNIIVVFVFL